MLCGATMHACTIISADKNVFECLHSAVAKELFRVLHGNVHEAIQTNENA